ncbi:MAG: hypothetical protein J7500_14030 [Sphingomonas sp.]|uniref:DUF4440 domain-containing protein n=1 Tax=Sphingomonas sp. TaxID=28214 RepID=UPI001AFD0D8F|nr:DUF4440 domain-containing protein [Sphingomonas sp.]MBO9623822.1 hypothetical protein [Sphingomonas sp.]
MTNLALPAASPVIRSFRAACLAGLMILDSSGAVARQRDEDPIDSLVAAERRFAADVAQTGISSAFRAHAAPNSILLRPYPVPALTELARQPDDPAVRLEWEPAVAAVAASNDLGFTTGPYRLSRGAKVRAGQFLTVWQRGSDGRWRWYLDNGSPLEGDRPAPSFPATVTRLRPAARTAPDTGAALSLGTAEDALHGAMRSDGPGAVRAALADEGYVLRNGMGAASHDDAAAALAATPAIDRAERLGLRVSVAGDLAVSYGRLDAKGGERLYYVRIWRRQGETWRLLIDQLS